MNSKKALFITLSFVALGLIAYTVLYNNKQAPAAVFKTIDGQRIAMDTLRGTPVLINFWSTSCTPCILEMPALEELHQATRDELIMIGVAMPQDRPDLVIDFSNRLGISYPIALDLDAALTTRFNIQAVPTTLLFNSAGQLVSRTLGIVDTTTLKKTVQQLNGD